MTKNSQKVASLEEQNKILDEVLKASREASSGKNKGKSPQNKEILLNNNEELRDGDVNDRKRKANTQSTSDSPTKKAKNEREDIQGKEPSDPKENTKKGTILEYPVYEANKEDDFYERSSELTPNSNVGQAGTSASSRRQEEAT